MSACGICGHTPACGSAEIDGTRYCHGASSLPFTPPATQRRPRDRNLRNLRPLHPPDPRRLRLQGDPMMTPVEEVLREFGFADGVVNASDEDAERMAAEVVRLRNAAEAAEMDAMRRKYLHYGHGPAGV